MRLKSRRAPRRRAFSQLRRAYERPLLDEFGAVEQLYRRRGWPFMGIWWPRVDGRFVLSPRSIVTDVRINGRSIGGTNHGETD